MKKIGLIAGSGELPCLIAEEAKKQGYSVFTVALKELASHDIARCTDEIEWISVGKLGSIIDSLKKASVKEAVMAGKAPKELLYKSPVIPDLRAIKLLMSLKDRKDDTIMLAIVEELKKEGIHILNTTDFARSLLIKEGILTKRKPSKVQMADVEFGYRIAKEIGRLDIGQTVVIKDRAVMAVEAIEGTDRAIKRGGELAGGGAVVVKVSKPQQDLRFDVPVAGLHTIRSMKESGCTVLALEAERCLFIQKEEAVKEADNEGMIILGYKES
ncbi:MAG: UDP-2,3-diacylglucosamine diphosphatase LpxI [Thermodesulfovibrionales bacterium]|nr:UDP-2,3-diacylglucosamine diphosphatase LpxI [Thermodesulfovibrionales bacterium]